MIGSSIYEYAAKFDSLDAGQAWFFLMGLVSGHVERCQVKKCPLCDAIKHTAEFVYQQRKEPHGS